MSKRDKELFLFDILIAILKIEYYCKESENVQELKYDFKSWDAVMREFVIIGEATNYLIKLEHFSSDKRSIVDFRNILIHEYFGIDEDEIWEIITNYLNTYKSHIINDIMKIKNSRKIELIDELSIENQHIDFIINVLKELK